VDGFSLAIFLALAALSALPPDWKSDPRTGWVQVSAMSFGLVGLVAYVAATRL
jgi:hypothetical protein